MPTKPNKAGNQQPYIEAGNGDASGEYADGEGSNIHFTSFKNPNGETTKTEPQQATTTTPLTDKQEPQQQENKGLGKLNYTTQKGMYRWNEFWNKWNYYDPSEYQHYLDDKAKAEKFGYHGHDADKWKEADTKVLSDDEINRVKDYIKDNIDDYISKLTFDDLEKTHDGYKLVDNLFTDILSGELGEEGANYYKKKNVYDTYKSISDIDNKINAHRAKLAKEYIEKNFTKIKGEHTIDDDLKNSNPLREKGGAYRINCQRCPFTYELRRRGYDVEAFPNDDDYGYGGRWENQMIFKDKYSFKNSSYSKLKGKIDDVVLKAGEGSRFAIEVQWSRSRCGHLFIVENIGGKVVYMDSQTNDKACGERYLSSVATSKETRVFRMDNAEFAEGVKKTGFSSKEI